MRSLEKAAATAEAAGVEGDAAQDESPHAAPPDAGRAAHGGNPHGAPPPISVERENPELATGTIRVQVVDESDQPVGGAEVRIGVLESDGQRSEQTSRTGADGSTAFAGLAVGEKQAYRVTVPHAGARYGSTPFRLPQRGGFEVTVRRLPVTRDDAHVVLYLGVTSVELKDERVTVVQHARLVNLDLRTYVFPDKGLLVRLPKGFTAFQTQESMGDQRIRQVASEGIRIEGSIPSGEATLLWGFDLPIEGTAMSFTTEVPWKTFAYRVIADAAPGMELEEIGRAHV